MYMYLQVIQRQKLPRHTCIYTYMYISILLKTLFDIGAEYAGDLAAEAKHIDVRICKEAKKHVDTITLNV